MRYVLNLSTTDQKEATMDAVIFINFFLMTGVLIPGSIFMAARSVQPASAKTGRGIDKI